MRIFMLLCAALLVAVPASADEMPLAVELVFGHQVNQEREKEAGVTMALKITPRQDRSAIQVALCEELRIAADLEIQNSGGLRLQILFVVPHKKMAVEGYYLPTDGTAEKAVLVPGQAVSRTALDRIVARAGIPPVVLDETNVEHEISCLLDEPLWSVTWSDIRGIGEEEPATVIERAHYRFLAIFESVVAHATGNQPPQQARRATNGG